MRITLQVLGSQPLLPLSYKYELSACLYHLMEEADPAFARFLHDNGYMMDGKRYKLFTFSDLDISRFKIDGDRMRVLSHEISFVVSFFVDKAAESLVFGIFQQASFLIGDQISQIHVQVKHIEVLPLQISESVIRLKTSSPLVISKSAEPESGISHPQYLHPDDPEYESYFFRNLMRKYTAAFHYGLVGALESDIIPAFRLLSHRPKSRLIRIKAHRPEETRIRGYLFDFELQAPPVLIGFGMLSGFGVANAMGFGATERREETKEEGRRGIEVGGVKAR